MGLGGDNKNAYGVSLMRPALDQGYKVGCMIYRGAAGLKLTSNKLYSGNCYKDLHFVIEHIKSKHPQ